MQSITISNKIKANQIKQYSILYLLFLLIVGCDNDDFKTENYEQYTGFYKIMSFKSNIAVDLNNDQVTSTELTDEINSFGFNDLEIRPIKDQLNPAKLITFSFPQTWITFQYPSSPEGSVQFLDYPFLTGYQFESTSFTLEESRYIEKSYIDNVKSDRDVTINSGLKVVDTNHLSVSISKEYYDFDSKDWILLDIEVTYERY